MNEQLQQMQELLQKSLIKIRKLEHTLEQRNNKQILSSDHVPIAIIGTGCPLSRKYHLYKEVMEVHYR